MGWACSCLRSSPCVSAEDQRVAAARGRGGEETSALGISVNTRGSGSFSPSRCVISPATVVSPSQPPTSSTATSSTVKPISPPIPPSSRADAPCPLIPNSSLRSSSSGRGYGLQPSPAAHPSAPRRYQNHADSLCSVGALFSLVRAHAAASGGNVHSRLPLFPLLFQLRKDIFYIQTKSIQVAHEASNTCLVADQ